MEDRYLFKAKRADNGEWIEWNALTGIPHDISIIQDTICQCTGLKDKNGELIWENDVVLKSSYTDYDCCVYSKAYIGLIQYEDAGWSVKAIKPDGRVYISPIIEMIANSKDIEHFEVIGNIFDNPELLESEG